MAHKKKPVVRRRPKPTRGVKHGKGKRSRTATNARKNGVARNVARSQKGTREKRTKQRAKTPQRKHAPRKTRAPRKQPKRQELLLTPFVSGFGGGFDVVVAGLGGGVSSAETVSIAPVPVYVPPTLEPSRGARQSRDDIEDEGEDFHGPIGDSYEEDFGDIDFADFDWQELIDDIGDEEEDSYGETPK